MRQLLPNDLSVRVQVAPLPAEPERAVGRLQEVIERTRPGWVYLSAAHPFDPAQVVAQHPDILFFSEGPAGGKAANRIALVYDREQANYRAGMAIAALLGNGEVLERIGAGIQEASDPKVGILTAATSDSVQRESAAFIEGFSQLRDPVDIETREIGNLTDRVKARRLLEGMKEDYYLSRKLFLSRIFLLRDPV